MARVKRLFTGDVFTQRRRFFRTIRVVSAMSAASPLYRGTDIVSCTGHVGKCQQATSRLRRVVAQQSHPNEIDGLMPCLISSSHGSALIAGRAGGRIGDARCLSSIVPRARTSLLKRAPSRPLGPGTSFNCLSSFSVLRRLRPARSPPRSEIPTLLAPVGRHRCHTIERHHSSPTGVSPP